MAHFRFKLQKVLEARQSFEDQAKREFGEAQIKLREEQDRFKKVIHEAQEFKNDMAVRRRKGATVRQFQDDIQRDWINRRKIRDQRHHVKNAEDSAAKKRLKLVEAMRDRKVMEKLREKYLADFKKEVRKNEMKFADDIAGIRNLRRSDDSLSGE